MSNATFFDTVARLLADTGQQPIGSTSDFDANNLLKQQLQAKNTVSEMHTQIIRGTRAWWLERYYKLALSAGVQSYNFLTGPLCYQPSTSSYIALPTSPENIVEDSMTLIDSSGNKRGEPQNITFRMFRKYLYNPTIIPNAPEFWFMLPEDADGNLFIAVYPTPDQAYSLNFQAYLDPITLAVSTDVIMFPPKYQNILWQYSRKYFELVLAEGQEPTLAAWLEPLLPELRILTKGPTENRTAVDIGIEINRDWTSRRGYDGCDWNHAYSPG